MSLAIHKTISFFIMTVTFSVIILNVFFLIKWLKMISYYMQFYITCSQRARKQVQYASQSRGVRNVHIEYLFFDLAPLFLYLYSWVCCSNSCKGMGQGNQVCCVTNFLLIYTDMTVQERNEGQLCRQRGYIHFCSRSPDMFLTVMAPGW